MPQMFVWFSKVYAYFTTLQIIELSDKKLLQWLKVNSFLNKFFKCRKDNLKKRKNAYKT